MTQFKRILALTQLLLLSTLGIGAWAELPKVFITTDINIDSGDPDDRQSMAHLLMYANEVDIRGIVPDRWNAKGYEATLQAIDAYSEDYKQYNFHALGYPKPELIQKRIAKNRADAIKNLIAEAQASTPTAPLYVLAWGNLNIVRDALFEEPSISNSIRLITIGTGVMLESSIKHVPEDWERSKPCKQMNWNAFGRNDIYNDSRFLKLWWVEINWTYEGMFSGPEPAQLLKQLSTYGALGKHIKDVVKKEAWAQYFRVGDTPSLLYLIDPSNQLDDPTHGSWAGQFVKPLPAKRPHYYTDFSGTLDWDYADPCNTWDIHEQVRNTAKATLEKRRPEMYSALITKLNSVYHNE